MDQWSRRRPVYFTPYRFALEFTHSYDREFKPHELGDAAFAWFDYGREAYTLVARAESEPFPAGGQQLIACDWNEWKREWGHWYDDSDGKPFDQAAFDKEFSGEAEA